MKLRLRGNSLRLRLSKSEVAEIRDGSAVEEIIEFGDDSAQNLTYALVPTNDVEIPTAVFDSGRIAVYVPKPQAERWAETNQIGIEAEKTIAGNRSLRILIEKDFACLEPRAGDEDEDAFAHPLQNKTENQIRLQAFD